jgi:hypothetical protein
VMGAALERMFGAFRTVKASSAEDREERRVRAAAGEAWQAGVRAAKWSAVAGNTAGLANRRPRRRWGPRRLRSRPCRMGSPPRSGIGA